MNITPIVMNDILHKLLNEKGQPCLSIILPTRRLSPERELNQEIIHQGISKAKALLNNNTSWPADTLTPISLRLGEITDEINYNHLTEGTGIFISPNISEVINFSFPVSEKIILKNHFETRDISYLNQVSEEYLVLSLSKKEIHLFKSSTHGLLEIINEDFPTEFHEEYEYARPVRGLSYGNMSKGFEPDKSITKEMRNIIFLKSVDEKLDHYLANKMMFVISGVKEVVSNFMNITRHSNLIAGKIIGNYSRIHPEMDKLARQAYVEFTVSKKQALLHRMQENIGKHTTAIGLPEVWKSAYEGKGLTLAVEKDFICRGYIMPEHQEELHLSPPKGNYEVIQDAVDEVIEKVLEKNGEVVFMDEKDLTNMDHIAMMLRYS